MSNTSRISNVSHRNGLPKHHSILYFITDILVISMERVPINTRKSNLQLNKMDEGAFRNVSIRNDFNKFRLCHEI